MNPSSNENFHTITRCKRCIMPETVPGITFNKEGVCNYCLNYIDEKYLGREEFEKIIASIKKEENKYDCVVPLSGGRDSTFVLYVARAVYKLKVLAVSYDNEFRADQALINMKRACKILDIDFISIRSKRNIASKIVLNRIRAALSQGPYQLCEALCLACTYGYRSAVYRTAKKYKVPLIIWGESQAEATLSMQNLATNEMRKLKLKMLFNINFLKSEFYSFLQRLEFHVAGNSILSRRPPVLKNNDIREIRLFDYIKWDRKKLKETIMTELGWEKPTGHTSTWRTDCMLHPLMNYCFFKMLGCSKDCFGYSNMINSGQMTRAEALKQESETAVIFLENMRNLLEDNIGLSNYEIAKIESL